MTQSIVEQSISSTKKYSDKQLTLLKEYRVNGFNGKAAAEKAGYASTSIPTTLRSLKEEMIEIAEMEMVEAAPIAARAMVDMIKAEKPVPQGALKLNASQAVLDRVGLGKKDKVTVDHNVSGGIFIIPAKGTIEKPINE